MSRRQQLEVLLDQLCESDISLVLEFTQWVHSNSPDQPIDPADWTILLDMLERTGQSVVDNSTHIAGLAKQGPMDTPSP